jgi:hypothetical protein
MGKSIPPTKSSRSTERSRSAPIRTPYERRKLVGLSDVRRFFIRNTEPVFWISATSFNVMNLDEWVRRFRFISYIDCFDGSHPSLYSPPEAPHDEFESLEDIVNFLLEHPGVQDYVRARGGGKAAFLFFDQKTEELCERLGLEICFPSAELRERIDHKMEATRIGNRARVYSVPNVLLKGDAVDSWEALCKQAKKLGDDLVVQTPFGDSGHTTFFLASEGDWKQHAEKIVGQQEIKVMQRIDPAQAAVEACVTANGTIVGPLMTELVGFRELTPYRGGWCGNELFPGAFDERVRRAARRKTESLGEELRKLGYKGYFEVDYLIDKATGKVYLGEINPRVTGASSMTNLSAFCHADAPLFLFHLLQWFDVEVELDVEALNGRWSDPINIDSWSQMVIKHTDDDVSRITAAPRTGVWRLEDDGSASYVRMQTHRRTVDREDEAFFLRIAGAGDFRYEGTNLGILLTPGRLMQDGALGDRAKAWVRGIREHFQVEAGSGADVRQAESIGSFKLI